MGVALPNVVNLHYVTPEVFVHKVRGCGCGQRGLLSFGGGWTSRHGDHLFPSLPAKANSGSQGQPGLGVPPAPATTTPRIRSCNEMENSGCQETLVGGFHPSFSPHQTPYQATIRGLQLSLDSVRWVVTAPLMSAEDDKGTPFGFVHKLLQAGWEKVLWNLLTSLFLIRNCGLRVKLNQNSCLGETPQLLSVSPGT